MSKRIYKVAKELNLESSELIEICGKAGVEGKSSALASLSDEEIAQVQAYLKGGSKSAAAGGGGADESGGGTATATRRRPEEQQPQAPVRREDYIGPGGTSGKPRVLGSGKGEKRPPEEKPEKEKAPDGEEKPKQPAAKSGPQVRLAPMPKAQSPPPPPSEAEETKTQKPEIKLPADAIRASKQGSTPLKEHLRKHEERKRAKDKKTTEGAPAEKVSEPSSKRRKRDRDKGEDEGLSRMGGGREMRQLKRKRSATRRRRTGDEEERPTRPSRRPRQIRRKGTNTAAPRKTAVTVELPCSVRSFSEAIGVRVPAVLGKLMSLGAMANINATLDQETAEVLAEELDVDVQFRAAVDLEQEVISEALQEDEDPSKLVERPPVVTFLGHVDHGKTSLLDKIIDINVVSGESGGITQHIRAYSIDKDGRSVTFVDTPGHEAFTEMRARGANVTDVAVLVVAADDGVMPQTEEAISHARAAEVPIVVALNKIDLPGVDINRIYSQLAENDLLPAEWGGSTELVKTSAMTGDGIDDLLETLLTIAELHEYKANPDRRAVGTCLEAQLHEGRGVVAKMIVQKGTLHVGDVVVCGSAYGRVKSMHDTLKGDVTYESAGPSFPVDMTGLHEAPNAGDKFYVVDDIANAREIAERRAEQTREQTLAGGAKHVTLENLFDRLGEAEIRTLNLIVRADVRGSIEAIQKEFSKLEHPEVQIRVLQATVGGVTEADVYLADAADAVIIGFNVVPEEGARTLAEQKGVQIRRYDVIYKVTEDIRAALEGLLEPEEREVDLGRALVLQTFTISRTGTVAGCRVLKGTVERNARVRVIRENRIIGNYALDTLRREKDDVREVREGMECGIKLAGFNDVKEGDILEVYKVEEVRRTF